MPVPAPSAPGHFVATGEGSAERAGGASVKRDTLLIELRTEELPPKALARLGKTFADSLADDLRREKFLTPDSRTHWYATPRRLAVEITDVREQAPDSEVVVKGPSVKAGLDANGAPTPALIGFARKRGVAVDALVRVGDGKQEVFAHHDMAKGGCLGANLAAKVEEALKGLPVPKVMRWGDGEAQFVRPVHGLLMLHGERVIPGEVLGLASAPVTRGHRFLSRGEIQLAHAREYESVLEGQGRVIASFAKRRALIEEQLTAYAQAHGVRLNERYGDLLDEVTALVEWPVVYAGSFDAEFLAVPQECLILTMQQHQKYFPLFDADGRLLNRFLIVSNMEVADPRAIINGNQRVVKPRLADAKFFFDQDRKRSLASRVSALAAVVYHNKLGSLGARAERLERLAQRIAGQLHADASLAARAGRLAKADLVTDMVGEFPELQGIMGRYYAVHDGENPLVAAAIEQHYYPRHAGDKLPQGNIAASVALADKLDALVGMFGIGVVPTGDRDPFGLRRAALGVLRILSDTPLPLDLMELIRDAAGGYPVGALSGDYADQLHEFMLERLRHHLRESGHPVENIEAVLAARPTRIDLVLPRLAAVREFAGLPEAGALAAANKRIVNILKKTEIPPGEPDVLLLQDDAERRLFHEMNELAPVVRSLLAGEDYTAALRRLAGLRGVVDTFFDEVMVMVDEPLTRQNRLAMLNQLAGLMNQVADISKLSG